MSNKKRFDTSYDTSKCPTDIATAKTTALHQQKSDTHVALALTLALTCHLCVHAKATHSKF